jgi:hypothetical protein
LIQSLRGIKPVENDILSEEKSVSKEKMESYAQIVKDDGKENENTNPYGVWLCSARIIWIL